jgi:hypothetical protein
LIVDVCVTTQGQKANMPVKEPPEKDVVLQKVDKPNGKNKIRFI